MTHTEKILNLLEVNENLPALVVDEESNVVSSNKIWHDSFGVAEMSKSFLKLFDKNVGLLIENSFVDCKIFQKVQRRNIELNIEGTPNKVKLLISPFKIEEKPYYYILIYGEKFVENLLVYPSVDDDNAKIKYDEIITSIRNSYPESLIEKKNLQFSLDSERISLGIKEKTKYSFTNVSFKRAFNNKDIPDHDGNTRLNLMEKIDSAENELYITGSSFIIEDKDFVQSALQQEGRVVLFPIINKENSVGKILVIGSIQRVTSSSIEETKMMHKPINYEEQISTSTVSIDQSKSVKIIYNKNNYDILDANDAASEFYGYELQDLKEMNLTQFFPPEELQKILSPEEINGKYIFNQLKKDGTIVEVSVQRENIVWGDDEACVETVTPNQPEEEIIQLNEYQEEKPRPRVALEKEKIVYKEKRAERSDFLSSLFHELLTPVNVILGFVQEIIDSIENPTEEQEESAQIIKDNQQVLLQTMNTAVQYAQLEEGEIKFKSETFEINKYILDLKDSLSRLSEKENKNVIFENIPDPISIKHDKAKLLAAISYFVKFVLKLTESKNVYVSFKLIDDRFYTLVRDEDNGISETVLSDMLEIFGSLLVSGKKNFGISPITIKLSQTLNSLLSLSVIEYSDTDKKSIALVTPISVNSLANIKNEVVEQEETIDESSKVGKISSVKIITNDNPILVPDEILNEEIVEQEEQIPNGKVDEKIVEDIEEEIEIVTEEIATVESFSDETLDLSNFSCLFIDDSVDTQLLFKSQMKDFKLLKVCSNLTEALPLLSKYNFDLVVVDINLNDTYNGFDALKIIRQFDNYENTPIVAVTAYSFEGDKQKFVNFGFTDYFIKPLLRNDIINSLEAILH